MLSYYVVPNIQIFKEYQNFQYNKIDQCKNACFLKNEEKWR